MNLNESWFIKSYSSLGSSNVYTISNTQIKVKLFNHSLKIYSNKLNDLIYITPETYIMYSTLHLAILSFDSYHNGKWVLSFHDESSAKYCIEKMRSNGIEVTDIQNLISGRMHLKNTIIDTIKNLEFPTFVAKVENSMKTKNV